MQAKKTTTNALIAVFLLVLMNCSKPAYHQNKKQINPSWFKNNPISFDFDIQDTTTNYTIDLVLNNNNHYPYSNIYFLTEFTNPENKTIVDTLEYQLALLSGEWFAKQAGNTFTRKLVFRDNIPLKKTGKYQLKIKHGMRFDSLQGIESIGIIINKH